MLIERLDLLEKEQFMMEQKAEVLEQQMMTTNKTDLQENIKSFRRQITNSKQNYQTIKKGAFMFIKQESENESNQIRLPSSISSYHNLTKSSDITPFERDYIMEQIEDVHDTKKKIKNFEKRLLLLEEMK